MKTSTVFSKVLFTVCLFCIVHCANAASRYWVGGPNAAWNLTSSWAATSGGSAGVSIPASTDTVYFDINSGTTVSATNLTGNITIRSLNLSGNITLTLSATTPATTLSLNIGSANNALLISSGSTLILGSTNTFTLNFITTTTQKGDISGNLVVNTSNSFTTTTITTASGVGVRTGGSIINNGGTINASVNSLNFATGASYQHSRDGGVIPAATWNANSLVNVTGVTTTNVLGLNQTFGNLTWNTTGQTATGIVNGTVTIAGNLTVLSGTLLTSSYALTVSGTTSITGTLTLGGSSGTKALGAVIINDDGAINSTAGTTITAASLTINDEASWSTSTTNAAITISGDVTNNGTFTNSIASTYSIAGNLINNNNFTSGIGTYTFTGTNKSISGANPSLTFGGAVAMSGTYTNNIGNVNVTGVLSGAGTLTMGANTTLNLSAATTSITGLNCTTNIPNTVAYVGTAAQSTKNSATNYYNLIINPTSGIVVTQGAASTVSNNLSVLSGTFSDGGLQITGNASGMLNLANGAGLQLGIGTATTETFPSLFGSANISLGVGSTVNYNTTGGQAVAAAVGGVGPTAYGNLTLTGASVKTLQGAITVVGNLTIATSAETFANGGNVITVNGNVSNNGIHSGAGRILLSGGGAPHALSGSAGTYGNIELNDTEGATFGNTSGTTTVSGTFSILAGNMTLNSFSAGLAISGASNIANGGILTFNNSTGSRTFTGDITNNGSWVNSANIAVTIAGNLIHNGSVFTAGTGVYTFSGTTKSISGTASSITIPNTTVSGTLSNLIPVFNSTAALIGNGSLTMGANTTLNLGGTSSITTLNCITNTPNTVVYNGVTQTVKATIYYNLHIGTLSPLSTPVAISAGPITINNNFMVNGGSFADAASQVTGNTNGVWMMAANTTYTTTKSTTPWMPALYPTANITLDPASTFNYNGGSTHNIVSSPNGTATITNYGTLGIGGSTSKTLATPVSAQNIIIAASSTLNDGGFQISGPGTSLGTLTLSSASQLSLTNINITNTSNYFGPMPLFANYAMNASSYVNYNALANQSIYPLPSPGYGNLRLQATVAATKTLSSGGTTTFIQGSVTLNSTNTLVLSGQSISIAGATPISNSGIIIANAESSTISLIGTTAQSFSIGSYTGSVIDNLITSNAAGVTLAASVNVNNLSINSGVFSLGSSSYTLGISANYSNNGTLTANGTGATIEFKGVSPQNFNVGSYTNSVITNFKVNNAAGVTLNAPVNVTTLNLTSGNLKTTTANLLTITGTAVANVVGGSNISFVNGPLARNFTTTSTGINTFPIGKGSYNLLEMLTPSVSSGTVTLTAEVFDVAAGGTDRPGFSSSPFPSRYWKLALSGIGTITSAGTLRLLDASMTLNADNTIGYSSAQTGAYSSIGGTNINSPLAGNISNLITVPLSFGYFKIGTKGCMSGTYTIGASGVFNKLSDAVITLNNAVICGENIFELQADYDGATGETFPVQLNALNYSGGQWAVIFRPASAVSSTLSTIGDPGSSNPLISLNGADYITFDGVPGGSTENNIIADGKWIIRNSRTSSTVGPVFQFSNAATFNSLKYCTIESNCTLTSNGAIILATSSANSSNIISFNNIHPASGYTLSNGIYNNSASNSSNTISNNNIFDFTNNGILLNMAGNSWAISGNSFYQTNISTTSTVAIAVLGGNSHYISANFIGGSAANAQGSPWINNAALAVTGILLNVATSTPTIIDGNIIQNINLTNVGASTFMGINAGSGLYHIGSSLGNIIGDILSLNSIRIAGSGVSIAINCASSTSSCSIFKNTITNISATGTGSNVAIKGIVTSSTANYNISSNIIKNLFTSSSNIATGANSSVIGISQTSSGTDQNISQNKIFGLTNNTVNAALAICGIVVSSGMNNVDGNLIYSFYTSSSSTSSKQIGINAIGGSGTYSNNMIRLGIDTLGNAQRLNPLIVGVDKITSISANFYHNSIYIGGDSVGSGLANTFAFRKSSSGVDNILNNIFLNARSNAIATHGGKHYAVSYPPILGFSSNYNILYASGIDGNIASLDGGVTPLQNLIAYKVAAGFPYPDLSSLSADPNFINPSAPTPDLHVIGPSPAEGAGIPILEITEDFDGDLINDNTPIDIGADAMNSTTIDIVAPAITYTPISGQAACGGNYSVNLLANIIDVGTGVATSGSFIPRIYYKKSSQTNWVNAAADSLISGNGKAGTWSFTINYVTLGVVPVAGDVFQYYIVAQDMAWPMNIGYSNFDGTSPVFTDVNTMVIQNNNPGSFTILTVTAYPATATLGISGTYNTFNGSSSSALFYDLSNPSKVLMADMLIKVISDVNESSNYYPLTMNVTQYCGGNHKVIIQPSAAVMRTISGTGGGNPLLNFANANNIVIDGSFNGMGRYLTIQNTSISNTMLPTLFFYGGTHDVSIKNCIIEGNSNLDVSASNYVGSGVICFAGNTFSGTLLHHISLDNNVIRNRSDLTQSIDNSPYMLVNLGVVGGMNYMRSNISVTNNELFNFRTTAIWGQNSASYGSFGDSIVISGNKIYEAIDYGSSYQAGIYLDVYDGNAPSKGHVVRDNVIGGNASPNPQVSGTLTNTGSQAVFEGIVVNANSNLGNGDVVVGNNIISNITVANGSIAGIDIIGGSVDVVGNTIGNPGSVQQIQGNYAGAYVYGIKNASGGSVFISNNMIGGLYSGGGSSSVFGIYQTGGVASIRNNTIRNSYSLAGSSGALYYSAGIVASGLGSGNVISGNTIERIGNSATTLNGTNAASGIVVSVTTAGNVGEISGNRLSEFFHNGASGGTSMGIQIQGNGSWMVGNNMINMYNRDYAGTISSSRKNWVGIADYASGGSNSYYYNSVLIQGQTAAGGTTAFSSYAFLKNPGGMQSGIGSNTTVKNNIFINCLSPIGYSGSKNYAIGNVSSTPGSNWVSDSNLLSSQNTADYPLGKWGNSDLLSLSAWRSTTGNDVNSPISGSGIIAIPTSGIPALPIDNTTNGTVNPYDLFVDPSVGDLHIKLYSNAAYLPYHYVHDVGAAIPSVSSDYDGDYRPMEGGPDLGADEFMTVPCMAPVVTSQTQSQSSCEGGSVTFSIANTGSATVNYQWKKNGNIIGNSNNSSLTINPIGMGDAGSYSVLISNSCGIDSSMVVTLTVNARPTALISGTANICNGQSVALNIAVSGNGTISGILSDGSSFSGNAPNISVTKFPTSNTTYTVSSVSDNHCAAMPADLSGSAAVTVNARPMAAISGSTTICNGQNVSLALTVSGAGTIYGTLSDGTPFNGTAPTILVVVSPSSNITYTIASLSDANCMALAQDKTGSAIISVNQRPTSVISGSTTICNGQSVSIPIAVSGSGIISGSLSDGTVFSGTAPTIYAVVSPVANTNYVVNSLSNAVCTAQSADMQGFYSVNVNPALVAYHTVFSEDFGTAYALPAAWSSSPSYYWTAEWASSSTGYTGASGYSNAVGHNNDPQDLSLISPAIDFSNYSSGKLTFGLRKTLTFTRDIAVEVSADNFATVAYSKTILNANFPSTTYWGLITINLGSYIDHASSVKIRWRLLGGPAGSTGNIRIDDVVLSSGTPVISPAGPLTICSGGNVMLSSSAGSSFLWSPNNETTQSIQVNTSGSYSVQVNGCATSIPIQVTINSASETPIGDSLQIFCLSAIVADLQVQASGLIQWYNAPIGGAMYLNSDSLINGQHYYGSQRIDSCFSVSRLEVTVLITSPPSPPIAPSSVSYCSIEGKNVNDLISIMVGSNIRCYSDSISGTLYTGYETLATGQCFASQTINNCESSGRSRIEITVNQTPLAPVGDSIQNFCQGAMVAQLVATGNQILWFDAQTGGTQFTPSTPLINAHHYYGSQAIDGCPSSSRLEVSVLINPASLWLGSNSSDWDNPYNWCGGVPLPTSNVIIPSGAPFMPIVNASIDNPAVCNNLTINSGATLTIDTAKALTVQGLLTNNAGQSGMLIKSSQKGSGSLIHQSLEVPASVQLYLEQGSFVRYHYISSPVANANTNLFSGYYMYRLDEPSTTWLNMTANQVLDPMRGYTIYKPSLQNSSEVKTLVGKLSSGQIGTEQNVSRLNTGWNLVGNPYPSAIDWEADYPAWTRTNIVNSVYTWSQALKTYTAYVGGVGINGGSNIIPPMQGFMVRVDSNEMFGTLIMTNAVRVHEAQSFWKDNVIKTLRLTVSGEDFSDETLIRFNAQATNCFDSKWDAYKLFSEVSKVQLYTLSGNEFLSINTLPENTENVVVPIQIKVNESGNYKIIASELESFPSGTSIYLEDLRLHTITNISETPVYSFKGEVNVNVALFNLHFNIASGNSNMEGKEDLKLYAYNNILYIHATKMGKIIVEVYDVLGKKVFSTSCQNVKMNSFDFNSLASGYYLVRLKNGDKIISEKILLH